MRRRRSFCLLVGIVFALLCSAESRGVAQNFVLTQTFDNPTMPGPRIFGTAVALDGDRVLLASPGNTGAQAYLFDATTGAVLQTFDDPSLPPLSGTIFSAAMEGNFVVFADGGADAVGPDVGQAYIFDATTGILLQTLNDPTPTMSDQFGRRVAIDGNLIAIGARFDDTLADGTGQVHIFDATTGSLVRTIDHPTPFGAQGFGSSVALDGDNLLVGAEDDDTQGTNVGRAFLFDVTTGNLLQTFDDPTVTSQDAFGSSVAIDGNNVVIGARLDDTNGRHVGQAHLFDAITGNLLQTFDDPTITSEDQFGHAVAVSGNLVLVGAPFDDTIGGPAGTTGSQTGQAHLFDATTGNLLQTFDIPTANDDDEFGGTVAIDGNRILIGAPGAGLAYLFTDPGAAPVALDDIFQVAAGQILTIIAPGVLANDTDAENDPLTATLVSGPSGDPTFALNADGSFTYTPQTGTTSDSFTYMVSDGVNQSNVATVTITVTNAPVALPDSYTVQIGQTLNVNAPGVLANDSDADNDPLTAVLMSGPSGDPSFVLNADGSFSYTPSVVGQDSFTYAASDGSLQSGTVTVTIDVIPEPPSCFDLIRIPADNYETFVQSTLATEISAIESLLQSGDLSGATALQQATIATLVQQAANAVAATQTECANCTTQLQANGQSELIPNLNTACIAQIHRIGSLQANGISQLESVITPATPSHTVLLLGQRYQREIGLNAQSAASSFDAFSDRYTTIVRRHTNSGNTTAADAAVDNARSVLQRTSAARVQRIQQLCDNFVARLSLRPGSHQLIAAVTAAANAAIAEVQLAEAEAMRDIEAAPMT